MRSRSPLVVLTLATVLVLPPGARAEEPEAPRPAPAGARKRKPAEKLEAWPKPADKDAVLLDIERLCKSRTPEMGVQARESLELAGAAAAPFLLERLGKERDESAVKRLKEVLTAVTSEAHTRLLAREFESRFLPTRTYALWRASAFPDKEVRASAEAAWARVVKQAAKADAEERYAAALCAASTGSVVGLDGLYDAAEKSWDRRGPELRAALEGVRGPEATALVVARLKGAERKQKVAVLRMLAGCGDRTALATVRPFLDESDNQVCVAAINACRGIVEGAPPQEQLPVFEAIETAKKWKERL